MLQTFRLRRPGREDARGRIECRVHDLMILLLKTIRAGEGSDRMAQGGLVYTSCLTLDLHFLLNAFVDVSFVLLFFLYLTGLLADLI